MPIPSNRIIAVYFGSLPGYLPLWLRSCANNPEFQWVLICDHEPDVPTPANVSIHRMTFAQFRDRFEEKLQLKISLEKPYKICDFRPAFGYVFSEFLAGVSFWGYCDLDVIWGNLSALFPENWSPYDKLMRRGHLTFFRNSEDVKKAFTLGNDALDFRTVLTQPQSFIFDETPGIHKIMQSQGFRIFEDEILADIDPTPARFTLTQHPNFRHQAFTWEQGRIFQRFINETQRSVQSKEFAYIHFQKRAMPVHLGPNLPDRIAITPRGFKQVKRPIESAWALDSYNRPSLQASMNFEKEISELRIKLGRFRRGLLSSKTKKIHQR